VFSPSTTVAAGTLGQITAFSAANKAISSVADSVGNTWGVDITGGDGTRNLSFASSQITTPITSGDTITVTWSAATNAGRDIWLFEITGAATSSVYDTTGTGAGTGTAVSVGPTATLAQADEIAIAIIRSQSSSPTMAPGATWTSPASAHLGARTACEYKIVAATTAITADGTWSSSVNWNGRVATYKAAAAAAGKPKTLPLIGVG
jgi:hypothetical protein